MKIRMGYTESLEGDDLIAFARYAGINPKDQKAVREALRQTLLVNGTSGLEDEIQEGYTLLAEEG
jgi:hypothetical protein